MNPPSSSITTFISRLNDRVSKRDLEEAFSKFGPLKRCEKNRESFAFLTFDDERDAEDAIEDLNGTEIQGCRFTLIAYILCFCFSCYSVLFYLSTLSNVYVCVYLCCDIPICNRINVEWTRESGRANKTQDLCYECNEPGHFGRDCPIRRKSLFFYIYMYISYIEQLYYFHHIICAWIYIYIFI